MTRTERSPARLAQSFHAKIAMLMDISARIERLTPNQEFALILAICFGYFVASSTIVLARGLHSFDLTTGRLLRGIIVEVTMLALCAWVLTIRGRGVMRLGFRVSWTSIAAGILLFVVTYALYIVSAIAAITLVPGLASTGFHFVNRSWPALLVLFAIVNSVFEESAVTGYVITAMEGKGVAFAVSLSTLVRVLYHLYQGPMAAVAILPIGVLFGFVYWRWRNLWPLVIAHTLTNLASFWIAAMQAGSA